MANEKDLICKGCNLEFRDRIGVEFCCWFCEEDYNFWEDIDIDLLKSSRRLKLRELSSEDRQELVSKLIDLYNKRFALIFNVAYSPT